MAEEIARPRRLPLFLYLAGWGLFFAVVWSRALRFNSDGGLSAGHVNIWGDWAIHMTMGSAMSYRDLIPTENPLLMGTPFRYPFFVNLLSAVLVRMGVPFFTAFTVPSFFFCWSAVLALYFFFRSMLGARGVGLIAALLFLFNGGLGFLTYFSDVAAASSPWHALLFPPKRYTALADLHWINVIDSMFIPQRSFQLGFPLAAALLALVHRWWGPRLSGPHDAAPLPRGAALPMALGALLGFLPIVHAHSFLAGVGVMASWIVYDVLYRTRPFAVTARWWGIFSAASAVTFLPLAIYLLQGTSHVWVMTWNPGWYASTFREWISFWAHNWGVTPLAALAGFALCARSLGRRWAAAAWFFLPYVAVFIAANLFTVHPWIWDNTKVIVWSAVGFSAMAAVSVVALWSASRHRAAARAGAAALFIVMTLSGALDVYRILIPSLNTYQLFSNEELFLADRARRETPPDAVWLAGPYHNNWVFNLTGRQTPITYTGWLWTHGYSYTDVERDVWDMYADAGRDDLLRKYHISYVSFGDFERDEMEGDEAGYAKRFPVIMSTEHWRVYQVTGSAQKAAPAPTRGPLKALLPRDARLPSGLTRRVYRGKYFYGECMVKEGVVDVNFQYDAADKKPFPTPVYIEWEGFLKVNADGPVRFSLVSDDGASLAIDERVVFDQGAGPVLREGVATVEMTAGYHRFKLRYFDVGGGAVLSLGWTATPGAKPQFEPQDLYH